MKRFILIVEDHRLLHLQDLVAQPIELSNQTGSDTRSGAAIIREGMATHPHRPSGVPLCNPARGRPGHPADIPNHAFEHPEELPAMKIPACAAAQLSHSAASAGAPASKPCFTRLFQTRLSFTCTSGTANAITCNTRRDQGRSCDQALRVDYTDPVVFPRVLSTSAFTTTLSHAPRSRPRNHGIIVQPDSDAFSERINFPDPRSARQSTRPVRLPPVRHPGGGSHRAVDAPSVALSTDYHGCFSSWRSVDPRSDRVRGSFPLFWRQPTLRTRCVAAPCPARRAPIVAVIPGLAVAVGSTNEASDNALHTPGRIARGTDAKSRARHG